MAGYTRTVSGQRLGKHVPVARQQILNIATVGLQHWKSCVLYVVRAESLYALVDKSNDLIGNGTRDLPACSIVS
jgi:hypothetical protein